MLKFSFYPKNLCCDQNFLCFVSAYFSKSCLVFAADNKTNIPCFFIPFLIPCLRFDFDFAKATIYRFCNNRELVVDQIFLADFSRSSRADII